LIWKTVDHATRKQKKTCEVLVENEGS